MNEAPKKNEAWNAKLKVNNLQRDNVKEAFS